MSDAEKITLKALDGVTSGFKIAVDKIYTIPEIFIRNNFSNVFAAANATLPDEDLITLLNRPVQSIEKTLEEKLRFVYDNSLPLLKQKLHEEIILQQMALLIGLSQEVTLMLIRNDFQNLIESVTSGGFSIAEIAKTYHRAAQFISGFSLTNKEVNHFLNYKMDFDTIDFKAITLTHWQRINDYVRLRNVVPQSQAFLTDVFADASASVPSVNALPDLFNLATGWDLNTVNYLIHSYYRLTKNDFKNEIAFLKVYNAMQFVLKTGLSAQTLAKWAKPETGFDNLNAVASLVKSTVKAKYEVENWLKLTSKFLLLLLFDFFFSLSKYRSSIFGIVMYSLLTKMLRLLSSRIKSILCRLKTKKGLLSISAHTL
jgi:hypothetical protein